MPQEKEANMEIYESIWSKKIGHRLAQITQIEKYKFEDEARFTGSADTLARTERAARRFHFIKVYLAFEKHRFRLGRARAPALPVLTGSFQIGSSIWAKPPPASLGRIEAGGSPPLNYSDVSI